MVSHVFLFSNLTAVSLTARARHGELPLPMPIIQSKKQRHAGKSHVIIIAGMSKVSNLKSLLYLFWCIKTYCSRICDRN